MTELAKIDDELVSGNDFIKFLKFNGKFNALLEDFLGHKLTVHAAKKSGVIVTEEEIQKRADQYRRIFGLHRSKDMMEHLNELGVSLDEFGKSLEENIIHESISADVQSQQAVNDYFALNSPRYESVELSNIIIDSEGTMQEIMALLEDDPDCFAELAKEHSIATDTAENGGALGKVYRETLAPEIEAKIFNASVGDILGPFTDDDELLFEIFQVSKKYPAECDATIKKKIQKFLYDNWLASKMNEHKIEML